MTPASSFTCIYYRCTLQAQHCVQRQTHTERQPRTGKELHPPHLQHCGSGECAQGARILKALRGKEIREVPLIRWRAIAKQRRAQRSHRVLTTPESFENRIADE